MVKKGELYLAAKICLETIEKENNKELYSFERRVETRNSWRGKPEIDGEYIGHGNYSFRREVGHFRVTNQKL